MKIKVQNKKMIKTLKWLNKFHLGDDFDDHIRKTLIKIGKCPHQFSGKSGTAGNRNPGKCYYCKKTRKQIKDSKY
jgi:hypothetical protein